MSQHSHQNDVLGQVDNAHLANSDKMSPFHSICLELSEVHSVGLT
jgi:RNA-dependent RNA polymerase